MTKSMKATNQNFGATIRIKSNATARCTRQCANSGSPQPFFWSLPIASQEFCRKKSATMCLAVRSSIHPASAPTGIEEDIVGNNKLTPSVGTGGGDEDRVRRSAQFFISKAGQSAPRCPFMASPGLDCTSGQPEKHKV